MPGTGGRELLWHTGGRRTAKGQKEASLGAETLDKSRGNHASFLCDISKGELGGTAALHYAGRGSQDFFVGGFARTRRHGLKALQPKAMLPSTAAFRITESPFTFHLTLMNSHLLLGIAFFSRGGP